MSYFDSVIFWFLAPYVVVWEWQLGHKNLKLDNLLSLLIPLIWSNSKDNVLPCHSVIPHIAHLYGIKFSLIIVLLIKSLLCLEFSLKKLDLSILLDVFFREDLPLKSTPD